MRKQHVKQKLKRMQPSRSGGGPGDPKKPDDDPNRPKDPNERIKIDERNAEHIFRKTEGHFLEDTSYNRGLLENLVNDKTNYHGPDRFGKGMYGKILPNGKQLWAHLYRGRIVNGGINESPKPYNPISGFSKLIKPSQK